MRLWPGHNLGFLRKFHGSFLRGSHPVSPLRVKTLRK
jgi:hypothetical protein